MTVTDERVDLDVDLDIEPPCINCASAATWRGRTRPCGHGDALFCDQHYKQMRAYFATRDINCLVCGADVARIDWKPV